MCRVAVAGWGGTGRFVFCRETGGIMTEVGFGAGVTSASDLIVAVSLGVGTASLAFVLAIALAFSRALSSFEVFFDPVLSNAFDFFADALKLDLVAIGSGVAAC